MEEVWKDIKGFEGVYQVSSLGRVRSLIDSHGNARKEPKLRRLSYNKDGYAKIRLMHGDADVTARIHRLVAEAFIPNPENLETVNHKNGDKTDNRIENLEWADRSYQMIHAYEHGLKKPMSGTKNHWARLTEDDVRAIRAEYVPYSREHSTVALGKKYGLTNTTIGRVVRGMGYADVL